MTLNNGTSCDFTCSVLGTRLELLSVVIVNIKLPRPAWILAIIVYQPRVASSFNANLFNANILYVSCENHETK